MQALTAQERKLIDQHLSSLPMRARAEYMAYCQAPGMPLRNVDDFDLAESLYRKGWIQEEPDYVNIEPIRLTHEAWNRFALDEWQEVEEAVMQKKRGPLAGSW